jgi:type I restriction enzyme, S subunit
MKQAWPQMRLLNVMSQVQRDEAPASGKNYRQIGVRLWGQGAYERESIDGSQTQYVKLFEAREGDIVVNKIWARNGSVAVVSDALSGSWGSTEFPLFEPDRTRLNPRWMHWITKAPWFWNACDEHAKGTSGKNRIKPDQFLGIEIPLPPLEVQQSIVARIDTVQQKLQAADELRASIDKDIASLLAVRFQQTLTHAKWLPMSDVAPIVRRDVTVDHQSSYAELGIRSFGKGTFHKPTLSGLELGDKRVYRIEPGDLLFSNVFAWEGAIAVTQTEDAGRVGSHRFISCVPYDGLTTAEYLRYYFLTDEGMTKIRDASPGGAGRNRTLGLSKLMAIEVPIPAIAIQKDFVELKRILERSTAVRISQRLLVDALLPSLVQALMVQ